METVDLPDDRVDIALALAVRDGKVLVARRDAASHQGGLWEFPGGRVETDEEPQGAAVRELREETGLTGGSAEPLLVFVHDYPDRRLRFHAFLVRGPAGEPVTGDRPWAWVALSELERLPMPPANRSILRALAWRLDARPAF